MHLVESFSLNTGLKIDQPYLYDKFVPLPFRCGYITLQPFGKYPSRQYDYWKEVMEILKPVLTDNNIKVIQLGTKNENPIQGCYDMRGKTSFSQASYLIKNSLLHLGIDSFGIHFASGVKKKIVGIYSNMLPSQTGPYWSDSKDVILLEPPRESHEKPSYSIEEDPKTINTIKPEDIAKSVCKLLRLEYDYPYKTLYTGREYHVNKIEVVPVNFITNHVEMGVESMIVRMDMYFNEESLERQLRICPCSIVTDQPINVSLLQKYKSRINEYVFFVGEDTDVNYFKLLKTAGVKFFAMSKLEDSKLNSIKLKYLDIAPIIAKKITSKNDLKSELKGKNLNNIYYKSSCLTVLRNDLYQSNVYLENNPPVMDVNCLPPAKVIDHPDFWADLDNYLILEKTS